MADGLASAQVQDGTRKAKDKKNTKSTKKQQGSEDPYSPPHATQTSETEFGIIPGLGLVEKYSATRFWTKIPKPGYFNKWSKNAEKRPPPGFFVTRTGSRCPPNFWNTIRRAPSRRLARQLLPKGILPIGLEIKIGKSQKRHESNNSKLTVNNFSVIK